MGSREPAAVYAYTGLARLLRAHYDGLLGEPLPSRWVELMNCADNKERERLKAELSFDSESRPLKC